MRTDLTVKELISLARMIAELEREPNIRPVPLELKSLVTGEDDTFTMSYRRTAGITQFFTQGDKDDSLNETWLTRSLLKTVGTWNAAVSFVITQTIMWLNGCRPEIINPPVDSALSDLIGFAHVEGGEPGGVLLDLSTDKKITVQIMYGSCGVNMTLDKFLEMFLH